MTNDELIERVKCSLPATNPSGDFSAKCIADDVESLAKHVMEQLIEPSLGDDSFAPYVREDIHCRMGRHIIDDILARTKDEKAGYLKLARDSLQER